LGIGLHLLDRTAKNSYAVHTYRQVWARHRLGISCLDWPGRGKKHLERGINQRRMEGIRREICFDRGRSLELSERYASTCINVLDSLESRAVLESHLLRL